MDSHLDYAWEAWALDGVDRRARLTRLVRAFIELIALPSREVWMHDDGAGVAVWQAAPSEPVGADVDQHIDAVMRAVYGGRHAAIETVDAVLHEHRPSEPHHFLGTMGVRPDRQRQGLGAAVLLPVLERLDRDGVPACLETSTSGNVRFYGGLGFGVIAHLDDLPAGAPPTWVMWRPPA